ncbi:MAG: FAD-dependent monooxygenase [Rhodospirillales bacterium]|nr:FAD-dependent monooxygenase [Rhodospirillales bacterium]
MSDKAHLETSVLIIGGGPVGLALAGDLGWRGIDCILVEQTDGAIPTPKMNEVNIRTMEFCRRWGIAAHVMDCPFPRDYPMDIAFVTSLGGFELGRMPRPAKKYQTPGPNSPVNLQICSQKWFDPILREFAEGFPGTELLYRHRFGGYTETEHGISACLTDLKTGTEKNIEAKYLAACDGATSAIRDGLGIGLEGPGILGHPLHFFFRAPGLLENLGREAATFFLAFDKDGLWANIRIIDPGDAMWRLMVLDTPDDFDADNIDGQEFIRRAVGRDYDVELIGHSVWTRMGVVAERLEQGRVFIVGDAAHQLSPTGALGMNTGIGDAVDLSWKLAGLIEGWGGDGLPASYDYERRQVGMRNVTQAAEFHSNHLKFHEFEGIEDENAEGEALRGRLGTELVERIGQMFRTEGLQLGYRYEGSPICAADGTPPLPDEIEVCVANARPGARAPHAWLSDGRSSLDLYGKGFTLVVTGGGDPEPIMRAAAMRSVPLRIAALNDAEILRLHERALVLVRPDGHVAWRGDLAPEDPLAMIDIVRGAG